VLHGDRTRGWDEHAPYDAIIVAAGGPKVPSSLKAQLAIGGRLVIPVGTDPKVQELVRVTRVSEDEFKTEDIADVRFVPLLGEEGWAETRPRGKSAAREAKPALLGVVRDHSEPFASIDLADLEPLLDRIGDARVVLIGEGTHGTSEFYRMRERIDLPPPSGPGGMLVQGTSFC
jgi:protein-L-isoaspartate(D-aspartate) O-methyltransferase